MKKFIIRVFSMLLSAIMLCAVAACGGKDDEPEVKKDLPERLSLNQATFTEGDWADRFNWNASYIKHLDLDRLLYWYRYYGGVANPEGVQPYPDWESGMLWYGITMGHYLSACAMSYLSVGEDWYLNRVKEVVDELEKCQKPNGLLFAMDEERFDLIEAGQNINQAGPAFYYIHKTLMGLIHAYEYAGNQKALEIAKKLSDWVYAKTQAIEANGTRLTVLSVEYGGMAEALYTMYSITKNENYHTAARFFNEDGIKRYWVNNFDNLYHVHANTTIPKAIGFVRAYMAGDGDDYLAAAEFFWQKVVERYMYPNGGVSGGEAFNDLYACTLQSSGNPAETCCSYNMIKLSQYLYELTDDVKYIDYIERALLNSIMGSIEEQGCKTYYQHMHPNATRVYNPYDGGFWCCVGTGMENLPLAAPMLYYERDGGLDINILASSKVTAKGGMSFEMTAEDEVTTIKALSAGKIKLRLRIPRWCKSYLLSVNGVQVSAKTEGEYLVLDRDFAVGDEIVYNTAYKTVIEFSDAEDVFTFRYGPYQMVSLERDCTEIVGSKDSGWMADPAIYAEGDSYYVDLDNGNRMKLQKYGLITHETFTTFFKRIDG